MTSLALSYIMGLLARREHSEFEIRCKMQQKAFSEEEIEQVLHHCQQKGWQSDKRFTENYLRFRAAKGYGANRIRQELSQLKGISADIIDETLMESEIDWSETALSVLRKKFPDYQQKQTPKDKQKIWRYMLSHGFYSEEFSDFVGNSDYD